MTDSILVLCIIVCYSKVNSYLFFLFILVAVFNHNTRCEYWL